MRAAKLLAVIYLLFTAFGVVLWRVNNHPQPPIDSIAPIFVEPSEDAQTPQYWFNSVRSLCNETEVDAAMSLSPAPSGPEGDSYAAICWAMAGRTDDARTLLHRLTADGQQRAASLMFGVVHGAADAGREAEMGPAMELVLEYQPSNVMALYHAGSAAYADARLEAAREYLHRFVELYGPEDGWKSNAVHMLGTLSN